MEKLVTIEPTKAWQAQVRDTPTELIAEIEITNCGKDDIVLILPGFYDIPLFPESKATVKNMLDLKVENPSMSPTEIKVSIKTRNCIIFTKKIFEKLKP